MSFWTYTDCKIFESFIIGHPYPFSLMLMFEECIIICCILL